MPFESARALVVRTSDWSETSRIATFFTREFGKVRTLAKGGRRLRSEFEVALDLLTVCSIVLIRKHSGGLDLLTEARVEERFTGLRSDLHSLYSGYYIAELLGEGTREYDAHPLLFDCALDILRNLNKPGNDAAISTMRFELVWLNELGYRPRLDACAVCGATDWIPHTVSFTFGCSAGGLLCSQCQVGQRDRRLISLAALEKLLELDKWDRSRIMEITPLVRVELRQVLGQYISSLLGRRPRLLAYLE